jgi:hypothetical protein
LFQKFVFTFSNLCRYALARIESIANDYMQLRADPRAASFGGGNLDGFLGVDSDDEVGPPVRVDSP